MFFELLASKVASLEGAKEFTFLATIPRSWRGDWCTISCPRGRNESLLPRASPLAGVEQAQIGITWPATPKPAVRRGTSPGSRSPHPAVLTGQLAKDGDRLLDAMYTAVSTQVITGYTTVLCGIFKCKKSDAEAHRRGEPERRTLEQGRKRTS